MKKWKVECYGEGTSWSHDNLTWERANEIVTGMPSDYMACIVPMEVTE
jgi:hypothetical protein